MKGCSRVSYTPIWTVLLGYRDSLSIIFQSSKRGNGNQFRGKEESKVCRSQSRLCKVSEELLSTSSWKENHLKPRDVDFNIAN